MYIYLFIYLFVYLFIYLFIYFFIYSIYFFIYSGTKVEVKLKKGESGSWARLDIPATPAKPSTEDPAPKSAVETKVRQLDPVPV
jgi:hypothetical protein